MDILRTVSDMHGQAREWRRAGLSIALVPTMGSLHTGHLSLVHTAQQHAERIVVSLFVNPTQFGPTEDFANYPRDEARDVALLEPLGVHVLYAPSAAEMYPPGYQTTVAVGDLATPLCGRSRPTHFRGVTTVVAKLFAAVQPDAAVFGEKDYQQLQVIRRMTRDLDLPVRIVASPTVREANGLAMSSRNTYLTPAERSRAGVLYASLCWARDAVAAGAIDPVALNLEIRARIEAQGGTIDYAEILHPETLHPVASLDEPARAFLAVRFGRTRLIDNLALNPTAATR